MAFLAQIPERIAFRQALRKQYDESYTVVEGTELALAQQAGLRHILNPVRGRPFFNAVFDEVIQEHAQAVQENATSVENAVAGKGILDIFQWFIDNFDQILEIITKLLPLFV